MADGAKNGEGVTQDPVVTKPEVKDDKDNVTISQKKLDALLNKKHGKGAEKAKAEILESLGVKSFDEVKVLIKAKNDAAEAAKTEQQKTDDKISALTVAMEKLQEGNTTLKKDLTIERIASKNEITDVDYFKHLLAIANKDESFVEDTFIENLKTTKPYLFKGAVQPKIDNSPNKTPKDVSEKIKKATTMDELRALQSEV